MKISGTFFILSGYTFVIFGGYLYGIENLSLPEIYNIEIGNCQNPLIAETIKEYLGKTNDYSQAVLFIDSCIKSPNNGALLGNINYAIFSKIKKSPIDGYIQALTDKELKKTAIRIHERISKIESTFKNLDEVHKTNLKNIISSFEETISETGAASLKLRQLNTYEQWISFLEYALVNDYAYDTGKIEYYVLKYINSDRD